MPDERDYRFNPETPLTDRTVQDLVEGRRKTPAPRPSLKASGGDKPDPRIYPKPRSVEDAFRLRNMES